MKLVSGAGSRTGQGGEGCLMFALAVTQKSPKKKKKKVYLHRQKHQHGNFTAQSYARFIMFQTGKAMPMERGWADVCLLRIHTKMSDYEKIQLVKCDPPLLLESTYCKSPRKAINKKLVWVGSEKVSHGVPRKGGWLWSETSLSAENPPAYGHGPARATERCETKGVFGEWVCVALL